MIHTPACPCAPGRDSDLDALTAINDDSAIYQWLPSIKRRQGFSVCR